MPLWLEITTNLALTILGIILALWYSDQGAPKLRFELHRSTDLDKLGARVLHVKVTNVPNRRPFVRRQTAYACTGTITFLSECRVAIAEPMPIRWQASPEPVRYELAQDKIVTVPEPRLIRISQFIDIPPDAFEIMDVAVRFLGDSDAYGWNSDSYFNNWRNPGSRMSRGYYIAQLNIRSGDQVFADEFILDNSGDTSKFSLTNMRNKPTVCG